MNRNPIAVCTKLPAEVFDYPFFNDAVPLVRPMNSTRKELDFNAELNSTNTESLKLKGFILHTSHFSLNYSKEELHAAEEIKKYDAKSFQKTPFPFSE